MGLVSDGGVHSFAAASVLPMGHCTRIRIDNAFVSLFHGRRDTDPKSGKGFIEQFDKARRQSSYYYRDVIMPWIVDKRWNV